MRRVLVLRPEPGASETLERARALGLDAAAIPLFEVEPVAWTAPDARGFDALILTSANAVRCAGEQLGRFLDLPVYAVGEATAKAAREAGFAVQHIGDAGIDRLLGPGRLLHLCGEHRTAPGSGADRITAIPVYRARAIARPDLSGAPGCVALIHSPRAGRRFSELIDRAGIDRSSIAVAAISAASAEAAGAGWSTVEWPAAPSDDALLALAARLCNNRGRR